MTAPAQMLKPCPFCGGEAKLKAWSWPYDRFRVQCAACRCQASGLRADPEDAITAWNTRPAPAELVEALRNEIVNTPETADFMAGVPIEAAHQRERWGADHDAGKQPLDWFWLIGYLAQKAATAAMAGDAEKAKHHTISTAAALANWHAALTGADTRMRPGIEPPTALRNAGAAS